MIYLGMQVHYTSNLIPSIFLSSFQNHFLISLGFELLLK